MTKNKINKTDNVVKLYDGTRNKLDYVNTKIENMVHDFWMNDIVNNIFTPNADATEELENDLRELDLIISTGFVCGSKQWDIVKKYTALADEFRLMKGCK